ncbi:DUF4328 domain-containing protein [Streptomyces sp. NPDC088097]|uniref:DUF4328 domain-containing protein n=1 Tax=Streptomyces sp. NPDC088097 TaxID=3365823 RepID=UPI00380B010F
MSRSQVLRPRPPLPVRPPGSGRVLLAAMCALLATAGVADLFSLYIGARLHSEVVRDDGFLSVGEEQLHTVQDLFGVADQLHAWAWVACAAAFVTWFHRMRRDAGAVAPDHFRKGPGWAIGAWFVPVACLWMPYRIAVDLWTVGLRTRGAVGTAGGSFWPVNLWWGSFAGSILLRAYSGSRYGRAEDIGALLDAVTLGMVADALNLVAAAAAAHFAVRLTGLLRPAAAPKGTS